MQEIFTIVNYIFNERPYCAWEYKINWDIMLNTVQVLE